MKCSKPKVMSKPGKNNAAYSGFVFSETDEFVATKPEWFNYETVNQSLHGFCWQNHVLTERNTASYWIMRLGIRKLLLDFERGT